MLQIPSLAFVCFLFPLIYYYKDSQISYYGIPLGWNLIPIVLIFVGSSFCVICDKVHQCIYSEYNCRSYKKESCLLVCTLLAGRSFRDCTGKVQEEDIKSGKRRKNHSISRWFHLLYCNNSKMIPPICESVCCF